MGRNVMPLKQRTRYKRKKCETCLKRFSLYYFPKHKCKRSVNPCNAHVAET